MFTYSAILLVIISHVELRLLVHTEVGSIQGVPADDGDYVMFLGIPYARVNVSNPFGASIPHEKFDKLFEAFNDSAICPQMQQLYSKTNHLYGGSLDCLKLNVYVPNSKTMDKAVYLYIFGGRFVHGHSRKSSYGPKYLVRHDIIVVTINYRLGPYGFMCMDIPEIPGNQGLWDQYKAIKWVRDHIRAFGGNPQKITIGGHSSGALVVDMHLLTKQPRLFQQVILQSGTATNPGFVVPSNTKALISIAEKLGFITNDTYTALSFLAKADPETIIKATTDEYNWKPCIEKEFEGVAPFVVENPEFSGETNIDGVNILGGFTFKECIYSLYSPTYKKLISEPDVILSSINRKFNFKNDSNFINVVKHFYLGDDTDRKSNKYKIVDFLSDFDFVYPIQRQFKKYARHKNTNVYLYMFSYEGHLNRMKRLFNITDAGATHFDELGYIFTVYYIPDIPNSNDQRKIDQMTTLWTNFIKYGNPTPVRTELLPVSWPPLTTDTVPCLQIDSNLTVISRPFHSNMAFWDLFYDANLDKLKIVSKKP
ncbi:acetylcholinesterase-like [Aricia agestis]|uniref:acetylcholinesterase-like n=1 Tax=Aricia agestis TaxID=91739 RepID=UPI001C20408D|nr:acetylcholinesterase-like [Aricia agestis]